MAGNLMLWVLFKEAEHEMKVEALQLSFVISQASAFQAITSSAKRHRHRVRFCRH